MSAAPLPAFANVTIDAAARPAVPAADPRVSAAFALGWQMAELYRPDRRRRRPPAVAADLPGVGRLDDRQRLELGLDQLRAGLAALGAAIAAAGLEPPALSGAERDIVDAAEDDRRHAVLELHVGLLLTLTATNFRFGKAYGLGRALADTCRNPRDIASLKTEFQRFRVAALATWLDDLSSALPPHAGHSVGTSLGRWAEWAHSREAEADEGTALRLLRGQGQLWRTLLSGEKLGTDMLEPRNYLDAASRLVRRIRVLLLQSILRFPLISLLTVALFGGGVALILSKHTPASIAAGLGGVLASLGIGWKGLAASVGTIASRLEQPLWGAELDAAIVDAITLLPHNKRDHRDRRRVALDAAALPASDPDADA